MQLKKGITFRAQVGHFLKAEPVGMGGENPGNVFLPVPLPLLQIQPVVYHQCCILIGWATSRLYVIAHW